MRRLASLVVFGASACLPDVDVDESRVEAPRVLAIRAEPAEAAPGVTTKFTALVVGPDGEIASPELEWAYCTARRPLAELGPVNRACLARDGEGLVPLPPEPATSSARGALPRDGCRLFGPEVPSPEPGAPPGRPVEADPTGGYYQPLRLFDALGLPTISETRIFCGLAGGTPTEAREYRMGYRSNAHPAVEDVRLAVDGAPLERLGGRFTVAPGAAVAIEIAWPACGPEDIACGGAENYLAYDRDQRALVTRREGLRVAWYATAGSLRDERTGRAGDDAASFSANTWTAPESPGLAHLWVVVRDERGGTAWARLEVQVE